jgi:hypothetical protein
VRWPVTVNDVAWADLTFRASGGGFSDATKPTFGLGPNNELPVYRYTGQDMVGTAGVLAEATAARSKRFCCPPALTCRQGEVAVELSPSLAAAMLDGLQALNDEPFLSVCAHSRGGPAAAQPGHAPGYQQPVSWTNRPVGSTRSTA